LYLAFYQPFSRRQSLISIPQVFLMSRVYIRGQLFCTSYPFHSTHALDFFYQLINLLFCVIKVRETYSLIDECETFAILYLKFWDSLTLYTKLVGNFGLLSSMNEGLGKPCAHYTRTIHGANYSFPSCKVCITSYVASMRRSSKT